MKLSGRSSVKKKTFCTSCSWPFNLQLSTVRTSVDESQQGESLCCVLACVLTCVDMCVAVSTQDDFGVTNLHCGSINLLRLKLTFDYRLKKKPLYAHSSLKRSEEMCLLLDTNSEGKPIVAARAPTVSWPTSEPTAHQAQTFCQFHRR